MLGLPSHRFPFRARTHARMNSIKSRKSQSSRDGFPNPLCKGIGKGREWTLSRHRYAGLIVPQMSVQVVWGGGGSRFPSPLLCCVVVH